MRSSNPVMLRLLPMVERPRPRPGRGLALSAAALVLVAIAMLVGNGCGPSGKQRAIDATFLALSAGSDGFSTWAAAHERNIVKPTMTREEANEALDKFEAEEDLVRASLFAAFQALGAYAADRISVGVLLSAAADVADKIQRLERGGDL